MTKQFSRSLHRIPVLLAWLLCLAGTSQAADDAPALFRWNLRVAAVSEAGPLAGGSGSPVPIDRLRWDKHERALLWSYVALSAVDTYQTMNYPSGYQEGNTLLGKHPTDLQVVAFKALSTWGMLKLTDRFAKKRKTRKTVLWLINSVQLSVNVRNEQVTGGIIF